MAVMKLNTAVAGPDTNGEPLLLTRDQLAVKLGVTARTVASWDLQGRIPRLTIGRTVRYHADDVLAHLRRVNHGKASK